MMRNPWWLFAMLSSVAGAADYVDFRDGSPRKFGIIIAVNGDEIIFQSVSDLGGGAVRNSISRNKIRHHQRTVDLKRLESLDPERMSEYRNMAEELASLKNDPAARAIAKRLFLICVAKGNFDIRASAATNLPDLASTSQELKLFQSLAYFYGNRKRMVPSESRNQAEPQITTQRTLQLIQALRKEQYQKAGLLLEEVQQSNGSQPFDLTPLKSAIQNEKIKPELLHQLLTIETQLLSEPDTRRKQTPSQTRIIEYEKIPQKTVHLPGPDLDFGFDIEATKFENGSWKRPSR